MESKPQPPIFQYESKFLVTKEIAYGTPEGPPETASLPEPLHQFVHALWATERAQAEPACPYCSERVVQLPHDRFWTKEQSSFEEPIAFGACGTCGFWYVTSQSQGLTLQIDIAHYLAALKTLSINDPELGLRETLRHLSKHISDVYTLPPRRFEELIAQIYKDLGYSVRMTQQSRDGGVDLVLMERCESQPGGNDSQTIVECKRYAEDRSITVGIVRQLLGVQLEHGIRRAKI